MQEIAMNMHHCLLCLGSNYEYPLRLQAAREALLTAFPGIRFGKELVTEAIGSRWLSPFGNQLAKCSTDLSREEVRRILKRIEKENGRLSEDKARGIVKLDIDLLMYDDEVLKPEDMMRDFVRKSLEEI